MEKLQLLMRKTMYYRSVLHTLHSGYLRFD